MIRILLAISILVSSAARAADEADVIIDEILFLQNAEMRWNDYATNSVDQRRESLTYPELYQEELDSWLANELSWASVEPLFREEVRARYTMPELQKMVDSLREFPSRYPEDHSVRSYGGSLFDIGVAVAQKVYPPLNARLADLREQYEPSFELPNGSEGGRISHPMPEASAH